MTEFLGLLEIGQKNASSITKSYVLLKYWNVLQD